MTPIITPWNESNNIIKLNTGIMWDTVSITDCSLVYNNGTLSLNMINIVIIITQIDDEQNPDE